MRKRDPDSVIDGFTAEVDRRAKVAESLTASATLDVAGQVYSDAAMALAVAWEVFRSDWYIACINRDSSAMADVVTKTVEDQLMKAQRGPAVGAWKEEWVEVRVPKHPSLAKISAVLEPNEYNLALPRDIRKHAGLLAHPYSTRVATLSDGDNALIAGVFAIRNAIAHRSPASVSRLNEQLRGFDAASDPGLHLREDARQVSPSGLARYLRVDVRNGGNVSKARCLHLHDRVNSIAAALK